ncbi:flavodoxin [Streptomyces sp. WMMC500]|uniref:flavodoxin domain-containing protein n=1 Tax=Streptomyces sp. WMMC500 TaxID=3015154 RepID=UPI00248B0818|nr:flavodoxin domain-containing protein [Streptomyces sp. WMMC500]WBB61952.1 flavodoxin [Streptomyces sp. WMMC500]
MSTLRVLVAYGSKNGSTAEIAHWIAAELGEQGIDADVQPARQVRDLGPYGAVVLGSGVYAAHWRREAVRFARRHRRALLRRPVWLFSSGPLDDSAQEGRAVSPPATKRLADRVRAESHVVFGGKLDESAEGFVARRIVRSGKGGDFRDRRQIRDWAAEVAAEIRGTHAAA